VTWAGNCGFVSSPTIRIDGVDIDAAILSAQLIFSRAVLAGRPGVVALSGSSWCPYRCPAPAIGLARSR
jgi:hypothetical protein